MMTKFSPQIFETYFRLYGRVTTRENYMYTVGSSIFCMLYLMVFHLLTSLLQGLQVCKNYTLGL